MLNPFEDEALDRWFQRFNAPLKRLSAEERAELHQEVRQHLEALAAANVELGSTSEEALQHALVQFGNPTRIGRKMYQEWQHGRTESCADMKAIMFGYGLQAIRGVVGQSLFFYPQNGTLSHLNPLLLWMLGFPATALIGFGIGRKYPQQALKSALLWPFLWPVGLWAEATILYNGGWMHLSMLEPLPRVLLDSVHYNATTALLSCAVAYLASITKRGWYKPSLADFKLTLPQARRRRSR